MARDPNRLGCAAESLDRGEPLAATASRVRRWFLIEQPGAWGDDALRESALPPAVAAAVAAGAREYGVRPVLIRQRERDDDGPRAAFLARTDRDHCWVERLELDDPAELAAIDLGTTTADEPPGVGVAVPSLALVCTNGKHDPCCADFGRPVLRALREAGEDAWECSHIGGDRFAANLVFLPSGVYYGRVAPEEAARLTREHAAGILDLSRYRGRSAFPPLMQAAEIFARHHLGERRLEGLRLVSTTSAASADAATVTLAHDSADGEVRLEVDVSRRLGPRMLLTCTATGPSHPWEYHLDDLRTVTSLDRPNSPR